MQSIPLLSVVLICHNKREELRMVLAGLRRQDRSLEDVEIVVVDDGSTDGTGEMLRAGWEGMDIRYVGLERCGERARLRNAGAGRASGEYLIFLDSDMVPGPKLLSSHLEAMRGREHPVSLGTRTCLIDYDHAALTEATVAESFSLIAEFPAIHDERTTLFEFWKRAGRSPSNLWTLLFSHNFALRRSDFLGSGGFDPDFSRNWGAEDVELGYRLHRRGCGFVLTPEAHCYHLWHPSPTSKKIHQLRLNYDLFWSKHPDWEVELFCEEYKTWGPEYNLLREAILAGSHRIAGVALRLPPDLPRQANRVVSFGVHPDCLPPAADGAYLLPGEPGTAPGMWDAIGVRRRFQPGQFDWAFVSGRYREVHEGLFEILLEEAERVAGRVFVAEADGRVLERARPPALKGRAKVLFAVRNAMGQTLPFLEHFYQSLAFHLEDRGIGVGFQRAYDPFRDIPVHGSAFGFGDPGRRRRLEAMYARDWAILDDRIPTVMEGEVARISQRAVGKRIWWEEINYFNEARRVSSGYLPHFDRIAVRREADRALLRSEAPVTHLPVGVDRTALERALERGRPAGPFRILWITHFLSIPSGAREMVAAFLRAFPDDPDVRLDLLHSPSEFPAVQNHYLNPSFQGMVNEHSRMYSGKLQSYQGQLYAEARDPRIRIHAGPFTLEDVRARLAGCDCLVDTSGMLTLSPFPLDAAALGKKPILCNPEAYAGYLDGGLSLPVPGRRKGGACLEPLPEKIWPGDRWDLRYLEFMQPQVDALANRIARARANPSELAVGEEARARFAAAFDWRAIAERFADGML